MSRVTDFDLIEGVPVPGMGTERWQELKTLQMRPGDIILSCYPRSGSTWVRHILKLLHNGGRDDGVNLDDAVPWLEAVGSEIGESMKLKPIALRDIPSPRMFKVHLPYKLTPGGLPHTTSARYIYLARNPKDNSVSQWYFTQNQLNKFLIVEPQTLDVFLDNFFHQREISSAFGGWLNHVLEWWKHKDQPNILFLKYEDLKKDPHKAVYTIAKFLEIVPLTEELVERVVKESSFSTMSKNTAVDNRKREGTNITIKYLRKGVVGDWKDHYTPEHNVVFERKIGKVLIENGLEFDYE